MVTLDFEDVTEYMTFSIIEKNYAVSVLNVQYVFEMASTTPVLIDFIKGSSIFRGGNK